MGEPKDPARDSRTVLVVEDEEVLRRVVQRFLEHEGYTVRTAADGVEALRVLREQDGHVDLVLTDVMLPRMNGPALGRQLAMEWPRTLVLFMSGYSNDDVFRDGLLDEATPIIRKPFDLEELAHAVRDALDGALAGQLRMERSA